MTRSEWFVCEWAAGLVSLLVALAVVVLMFRRTTVDAALDDAG